MRHNNSTMQSKVTINMRRRLSVFVCNSSFSQTWHCRIASFRVQKGIGSIISQRHFDRARDSTAAAAITAYIFVKMDLIRAVHIGNDNRFCLKSNLKRYYVLLINRELPNRADTLRQIICRCLPISTKVKRRDPLYLIQIAYLAYDYRNNSLDE